MKQKLLVGLLAGLMVLGTTTISFAVPYVSNTSMLTGGTLIDFEGFGEGTLISNQFSGVTFSQDDGGTPMIDNEPSLYAYDASSGIGILTGSQTGGAPFVTVAGIVATFDTGVSSVEAFFSDTAPLGDYSVLAYNNLGTVIDSLIIAAGALPSAGGLYVGFTSALADIYSVQFGPSAAYGDAFGIDDFQFVSSSVPEPATMFLFGTGLLGLFGTGIRRKIKA